MKKELVSITREPDDDLVDVRVSLGLKKGVGIYIVFRGDPDETLELLERALAEAKSRIPDGGYREYRKGPRG
jgi:hypothetical protein